MDIKTAFELRKKTIEKYMEKDKDLEAITDDALKEMMDKILDVFKSKFVGVNFNFQAVKLDKGYKVVVETDETEVLSKIFSIYDNAIYLFTETSPADSSIIIYIGVRTKDRTSSIYTPDSKVSFSSPVYAYYLLKIKLRKDKSGKMHGRILESYVGTGYVGYGDDKSIKRVFNGKNVFVCFGSDWIDYKKDLRATPENIIKHLLKVMRVAARSYRMKCSRGTDRM